MRKASEEGSVLLAMLEVEKSALEWKRELVKSWLEGRRTRTTTRSALDGEESARKGKRDEGG